MTILIGATVDPETSLRHEAIHALKYMNLFTAKQWDALTVASIDRRTAIHTREIATMLAPSSRIQSETLPQFYRFSKPWAETSSSNLHSGQHHGPDWDLQPCLSRRQSAPGITQPS